MEQVADYTIVRKMRQGNHGSMYIATPPARLGIDDRHVALKVLDHHATDDEFRRIANELRLLNSAESPHVAHLLDAGSQDARLFLVMRYYASGSLEDAAGRLEPALILQCLADAARGAHLLHELGVAHRDIKPANVLIDDRGRGVLADLGLAQMLGNQVTTVGFGPIGALEFMCPALAWGEEASRGTDLWSLGATLHRAITGESTVGAIDTSSLLAALRHVMHTEPRIGDGCPEPLVPVLRRALRIGDTDPYPTAAALADQLEALVQQGVA